MHTLVIIKSNVFYLRSDIVCEKSSTNMWFSPQEVIARVKYQIVYRKSASSLMIISPRSAI